MDHQNVSPMLNRAARRQAERANRRAAAGGRRTQARVINPLTLLRPAPPEQCAYVMTRFYTALEAIAKGQHPGVDEWRDLSDAINTVETLCLHQHKLAPQEVMPTIQAATQAMVEAAARYKQGHRMGLSGAGLEALRDILAIYEQCLAGLTEYEMRRAQAETQRRVHALLRRRTPSKEVIEL